MFKLVRAAVLGGLLSASLAQGALAQSPGGFEVTFVNIYSQCPIHPPTLVFCGDGTLPGYGRASSTAFLTAPPAPIPNTDCQSIHAIRTIALTDGTGTLTLAEVGSLCPRSGNASTRGHPYTVAKTYVIAAGTGVFAGATGSGSDVNRSAGNEQVSVLKGTLTLP